MRPVMVHGAAPAVTVTAAPSGRVHPASCAWILASAPVSPMPPVMSNVTSPAHLIFPPATGSVTTTGPMKLPPWSVSVGATDQLPGAGCAAGAEPVVARAAAAVRLMVSAAMPLKIRMVRCTSRAGHELFPAVPHARKGGNSGNKLLVLRFQRRLGGEPGKTRSHGAPGVFEGASHVHRPGHHRRHRRISQEPVAAPPPLTPRPGCDAVRPDGLGTRPPRACPLHSAPGREATSCPNQSRPRPRASAQRPRSPHGKAVLPS